MRADRAPAASSLSAGRFSAIATGPLAARERRHGRGVPSLRSQAARRCRAQGRSRHAVADERAINGLRQEVRAAREVVSPNVCRVFDLVEFDGHELVSMEFVDGVTLADVLQERSPLGLQEAREIASQLLAGLEAIHAAGLVHRDIKPENVMLTRAGRIVVMDFGIARALQSRADRNGGGHRRYMAPEQARGEAADARSDVFSAGGRARRD